MPKTESNDCDFIQLVDENHVRISNEFGSCVITIDRLPDLMPLPPEVKTMEEGQRRFLLAVDEETARAMELQ